MKKAFGFAVAATMVIGGATSADVLYHNPVGGGGTARDQEYPDFPTYSLYLVADVNIPDPGFTITSVVAPLTINAAWAGVTTARLNLFPKVGNLPDNITDDPSASMVVNVSYDVGTGILSTVGLNLDVAAGDYWIGLTGQGDFGAVGNIFHLGGVNVNGDPDAYRNPGGAFGFPDGTNWGEIQSWANQMTDIALTVEGVPIQCPWDIDNNEVVGASDLLALLASWGPCKDCDADFDGDGSVGASDLLTLLANWGPCPK